MKTMLTNAKQPMMQSILNLRHVMCNQVSQVYTRPNLCIPTSRRAKFGNHNLRRSYENNIKTTRNPLSFTVRQAKESELAGVVLVERSCEGAWNETQLREELHSPLGHMLLALRNPGEEIIGYVSGQYVAGELQVTSLGVHPSARQGGVGSQLLLSLMETCPGPTILEVRETNASAIALYKKVGFCARGRRKGYYRDQNEDAIIMTWDSEPGMYDD
mmetsp:Transcript_11686/g.15883  ORF Transcript_11686/g.15883 Transcript_11686/m.15883 type:complete len:216 (+) Transcript_11686:174-821(+)